MLSAHNQVMIVSLISGCIVFAKPEVSLPQSQAQNIEYKAEGLRDPFQPPKQKAPEKLAAEVQKELAQAKPLPALTLQGIVWGGKVPQVIINNKVVKVGDTIEGVRITDINKNGVSVSFDNRQYDLAIATDKSTPSRRSQAQP